MREEQRNSFGSDKAIKASFVMDPSVAECVSLPQLSFSLVNHADAHDQKIQDSDI